MIELIIGISIGIIGTLITQRVRDRRMPRIHSDRFSSSSSHGSTMMNHPYVPHLSKLVRELSPAAASEVVEATVKGFVEDPDNLYLFHHPERTEALNAFRNHITRRVIRNTK